jgi:hypothetical protein
MGSNIWRLMEHGTESTCKPFQDLEYGHIQTQKAVEKMLTFYVEKEQKSVVAN